MFGRTFDSNTENMMSATNIRQRTRSTTRNGKNMNYVSRAITGDIKVILGGNTYNRNNTEDSDKSPKSVALPVDEIVTY